MVILIIAGILLMAAAIIAFRKFPGIRLRVIWLTLLAGALLLITGYCFFCLFPERDFYHRGGRMS